MATIAPWLRGPNVLQAMSSGAAAGAAQKRIQLQAYANALRHQASMASIAASRANANQRAKLAEKTLDLRRKEAANDLMMQQEALKQRGALAEQKAAADLAEKNQPRYMNVPGGLAKVSPGMEPQFIESPFRSTSDSSTAALQAFFGGGEAPPPPELQNAVANPNAGAQPPVLNQNPRNFMYMSELGPSFTPDVPEKMAQGTSGLTRRKRK